MSCAIIRVIENGSLYKKQRIVIVQTDYKFGDSFVEIFRKLGIVGIHISYNGSIVLTLNKKFGKTGSVIDKLYRVLVACGQPKTLQSSVRVLMRIQEHQHVIKH